MIRGRLVTTLLALLGMLLSCAGVLAQVNLATVRGTVTDPTGAVVTGAEVTLVHQETSASRTMATDQNGNFEIAGVQPGTYRLSINTAGFKTFVADDVILRATKSAESMRNWNWGQWAPRSR